MLDAAVEPRRGTDTPALAGHVGRPLRHKGHRQFSFSNELKMVLTG